MGTVIPKKIKSMHKIKTLDALRAEDPSESLYKYGGNTSRYRPEIDDNWELIYTYFILLVLLFVNKYSCKWATYCIQKLEGS